MMQADYEILENRKIARQIYRMVLAGDTAAITAPGQFVNIALEGKYLRRPISVCDWSDHTLTLIYKTVGDGTRRLSAYPAGKKLDLLVGLGNGYDLAPSGQNPLLLGGGVGVPPLYGLCKALAAQGKTPQVVLGFNTADEVFYQNEFAALGASVIVATADGSFGVKGFVTDAMRGLSYSYFYACGPMPMFRAIEAAAVGGGQYSFEERMGCGFGACMGCTCKTKTGYKRICREGPVLKREEVLW
jgi:dihydroorotate dehydrogenase electron transfer subunit